MDPTRGKARFIFRVGQKVEISFEENRLCGAWFPAVVVEDLGGNFLLVEYKCAGINGGEKLRRVSVDHHHIRPSSPKFKDISCFGLFDKVEAFFDFGWWSGVVTKNLADNRYIVFFKNTKKVKELGRWELRPHAEWKEDKWLTPYEVFVFDDNAENGFKHSEQSSVNCSTEASSVLSNLTDPVPETDKETCCTTEERAVVSVNSTETMKKEKAVGRRSIEKNAKPPKKLKVTVTSDDQTPSEVGQSKEVSDNTLVSPSGRVEKADVGGKTSEATKGADDQRPSNAAQSKEVSNAPVSPSESKEVNNAPVSPSGLVEKANVEVTKSADDQNPPDAGQSKEVSDLPVTTEVSKANVGGKTSEATKSSDDQTKEASSTVVSPPGRAKKAKAGGETSEPASNTPVGPSGRAKKAKLGGEASEATKNDQSSLGVGQSKEANDTPVYPSGRPKRAKVGGKTSEAAKSISNGKKTPGKRVKEVGLKSAGIKSAGKKGEISADNEGQKTLPEGAKGDSTKTTTPDIVEEQQVTENWPFRVVLGLQCKAVTSLQTKKADTPQLFTPLSPKTTGTQEDTGANTDTTVKRKRGRPFKVKRPAVTRVAVNNETNETVDAAPGAVNGENTLNRGAESELALLQDAFKTVKGKRGRRRSIISIETDAAVQGSQDPSVQRANGDLVENSTRPNSELPVETISDDQPLVRWLHPSATGDNTGNKQLENSNSSLAAENEEGETLSFEKKLSFWTMIESMEVFRVIPQNPHFRPLNTLKRSAREVEAINKMITFSCVAENISRVRSTSPKTDIEDHLKSLAELETHGFDAKMLKNRLTDMLLMKAKVDEAETRRQTSKVSTEMISSGAQTFNEEIRAIDNQMSAILAKRDAALSKKMKADSEIVELKAKHKEIEEALNDLRRQFDELAAAPLW